MKEKNPNIKRRRDSEEQGKFKFDDEEIDNRNSKFRTGKSDGRLIKKPMKDDGTIDSETKKKRGVYVKKSR